MRRKRMRSAKVTLDLTALMAASLTGCASEEQPDYAAICVDPQTQTRTEDDNCTDEREYHGSGAGFFWFPWPPGAAGSYHRSAASTTPAPAPHRPAGRAPTVTRGAAWTTRGGDIGTITRGGFGKAAKGSSGG